VVVPGNGTAEKWWTLSTGGYVVDMRYRWGTGGRSSTGSDDVAVEIGECAEVARIGWNFLRVEPTVASAYTGRTCVRADGEAA
jgi:hypothetical protein